jgi:hypothetical protein
VNALRLLAPASRFSQGRLVSLAAAGAGLCCAVSASKHAAGQPARRAVRSLPAADAAPARHAPGGRGRHRSPQSGGITGNGPGPAIVSPTDRAHPERRAAGGRDRRDVRRSGSPTARRNSANAIAIDAAGVLRTLSDPDRRLAQALAAGPSVIAVSGVDHAFPGPGRPEKRFIGRRTTIPIPGASDPLSSRHGQPAVAGTGRQRRRLHQSMPERVAVAIGQQRGVLRQVPAVR